MITKQITHLLPQAVPYPVSFEQEVTFEAKLRVLDEEPDMNELISDQKRQAVPTLNGFAYQIWQSLFRWVSLDGTGLIFLEGAEDIVCWARMGLRPFTFLGLLKVA